MKNKFCTKGTALPVPQMPCSRAALAAEVRFQGHPSIEKGVPQGLKPSSVIARCGTAKAVPFVQSVFTFTYGLKPVPFSTGDYDDARGTSISQ